MEIRNPIDVHVYSTEQKLCFVITVLIMFTTFLVLCILDKILQTFIIK